MIIILSGLVGLIVGSFANVCMYRLPRGESIVWPASHCPACQKPLRARDNLPLISFFWLKGRCLYCHTAIGWHYPLIEFTMCVLFLATAWVFQDDLFQMALVDLLSFYLLTISVIDYQHKIIPDELSLSLLGIGLLGSFWNPYFERPGFPAVVESLLAGLTGGGCMLGLAWGGEKVFKKEALGGGDVKLVAALGAILGWKGLVGTLVIGSLLGALVGGSLMLLKRKKPGDTIPYGPFLCLGAYLTCLFPHWGAPFLFP